MSWHSRKHHKFLPLLTAVVFLLISGLPSYDAKASVIRDTEIEDALLRIIRPMAEEAGLNPDVMQVRIVINNQYNAFVTADNMIYMHSGLIVKADTMLEVAGVLAHEIGHIASGHIPRRSEVIQEASMASILSAVAAIALSASGNADAAVGVIAGGTDQTRRIIMARSRQDEGVADEWAIKLMQSQNLSLKPMAEAMRRIGAQRLLPQSRQSDYYLTHPSTQERSAVFQDHVNTHEHTEMPEPEWMEEAHRRIKTKLEGWTLPPKSIIAQHIGDDSEESLYKKAIAFYRLSDVMAAKDTMEVLLARKPDDGYYWEFYADVMRTIGDADTSIIAYKTALSLMESELNRGQVYLSLGRAFMIKGDVASMNEAITMLERAHFEEQNWAFVKNQLGIAYGKAGYFAAADLILAEEALLRGNNELAQRLAKRVSTHQDATAQQKQVAADILNQSQ